MTDTVSRDPGAPREAARGLPAWQRRLLTVPTMYILAVCLTLALPAAVMFALLADLARFRSGAGFTSVRMLTYGLCFLWIEVFALALLGAIGLVTVGQPARRLSATYAAQRWFVGRNLACAQSIFDLRFEVEGDELVDAGPLLAFVRHTSIVDILVPGVFLANRHGLRLRYVLKRELLWEPCLDIAGNWLPNHFVARDGSQTERELVAIRALKRGLTAGEGVVIYPEGTRFTAAKRARVITSLADEPVARERAERLHHLLPPRPGGPLALLAEAPACDVLFVGHAGLEGFEGLGDIWSGALQGRLVRLKFWRVPAAQVPGDGEARLAWLAEQWQVMDDWLEQVATAVAPAEPVDVA